MKVLHYLTIINTLMIIVKAECITEIVTKLYKNHNLMIISEDITNENPKIVLDPFKETFGNVKDHFDKVIDATNDTDFVSKMNQFRSNNFWRPTFTPRRRFLIFIKELIDIHYVFDYLKSLFIINVMVVHFESNATFTIYKPKSYCNQTLLSNQTFDCNDLSELMEFEFEKSQIILEGCSLHMLLMTDELHYNYADYSDEVIGVLVKPVLFLIKKHNWQLNFFRPSHPVQRNYSLGRYKDLNGSDMVIASIYRIVDHYTPFELSDTVLFDDYVWLLPKSPPASNFKILIKIYQPTVWILFFVVIIISLILQWLFAKETNTNYKVIETFWNIFQVSLSLPVYKFEKINNYRLYHVLYVIYAFHFTFMYQGKLTSSLSTVDTSNEITNIDKLMASNLKLYIPTVLRTFILEAEAAKQREFAKMVNSYFNSTIEDADFVTIEGNVALLSRKFKTRYRDYVNLTYFMDDLAVKPKFNYLLPNGSYYMESINDIINFAYEHGYVAKWTKDMMYNNKEQQLFNDNDVLTLSHLQPAFVSFLVGLLLGCIAFICEIIYNLYKRKFCADITNKRYS